jgi:hypothetical protein
MLANTFVVSVKVIAIIALLLCIWGLIITW